MLFFLIPGCILNFFVFIPFSWEKKKHGSQTNTLGLTVMELTMSSLCWQMDTSLTKTAGKTLTSQKRLVELKKITRIFAPLYVFSTLIFSQKIWSFYIYKKKKEEQYNHQNISMAVWCCCALTVSCSAIQQCLTYTNVNEATHWDPLKKWMAYMPIICTQKVLAKVKGRQCTALWCPESMGHLSQWKSLNRRGFLVCDSLVSHKDI